MIDEAEVIKVIYGCIAELNDQRPQDGKLIAARDTILVGDGGGLDSLSLITLMVAIEQSLATRHQVSVALLDELMSEHHGDPDFRDVGALADWVVKANNEPQGSD